MSRLKVYVQPAVLIYYLIFVAFYFTESQIVHRAGFWRGLMIFIVGGSALGLLQLWLTSPDTELKDPLLWAGAWMHRRLGWFGYLLNTLTIGAAPGVAVVLAKHDHPRRLHLTLLAAVLFAVVWVPIWHFVWK